MKIFFLIFQNMYFEMCIRISILKSFGKFPFACHVGQIEKLRKHFGNNFSFFMFVIKLLILRNCIYFFKIIVKRLILSCHKLVFNNKK